MAAKNEMRFECAVFTSNPQPTYFDWYLDDKILEGNNSIGFLENGKILTISTGVSRIKAKLSCLGNNGIEGAICTQKLDVDTHRGEVYALYNIKSK